MKKIAALVAVSGLFLMACSGGESAASNPGEDLQSPDQGAVESQDHPDFLRKMADPAHYVVNRNPGAGKSVLSTCGATDDAQYVNSYTGNLGVSKDYVNTYKPAVGAMESTATAGANAKYCSGTLIGSNLFLTAGHCVDSSTVGDFVSFNYERKANSTELLPEEHVRISAIVEDSLGGLDYAIVRLEGTPGTKYGTRATNATDPATNSTLAIIQHPARRAKQIEAGTLASSSGNYHYYGNIDTQGGSSGSGILNANGQLVGVHTNGGCTASGGNNSGTRMSKIAAASAVIN
ncbi:trypsin-like serine peptidase [Pendulispora albinea]|uniref:Serine protease n=1 Tax=Pendulispora albinea TaxID=2741071 RepID=A0ABZ2M5M7_9BACT